MFLKTENRPYLFRFTNHVETLSTKRAKSQSGKRGNKSILVPSFWRNNSFSLARCALNSSRMRLFSVSNFSTVNRKSSTEWQVNLNSHKKREIRGWKMLKKYLTVWQLFSRFSRIFGDKTHRRCLRPRCVFPRYRSPLLRQLLFSRSKKIIIGSLECWSRTWNIHYFEEVIMEQRKMIALPRYGIFRDVTFFFSFAVVHREYCS